MTFPGAANRKQLPIPALACERAVGTQLGGDIVLLTLDVTRNGLLFLKRDRQLPGQADQRLRVR
jgi:hypothetical protein